MRQKLIPLILLMALSACMPAPPATPTQIPPTVASPTNTPQPTGTSLPTDTPIPTNTRLPTNTPTPKNTPTPFACNDALGCVQLDPGEAIHVAYILSLSGEAAFLGQDAVNGLELAIERYGPLFGHDVQLTAFDDGCDPEKGREAALKFAGEPKMIAIFGTTCSKTALAAIPWLSKAGLVMISPTNTIIELTEPGDPAQYPGYIRTIWNDKLQPVMASRLGIEKLQVKTAAAIYSSGALKIHKAFVAEFTNLGGQILLEALLDQPNQLDNVISSIISAAPEMIYLSVGDPNLASQLIAGVKGTPGFETTPIISYEYLFTSELGKLAGLPADGVLISQGGLVPQLEEYNADILPAYREKFGQEPQSFVHAFAFDAVNMLFSAIQMVGVSYPDGTLYIPRQALRDALYATQGFQGITGTLSCSPTGDCADPRTIVFYQYMIGVWPPKPFSP